MNVQKAIEHPELFFKMFLHEHLYGSTTPAPFHSELFDLLYGKHRVIIAAPRAHAKSTICSFAYPIWAAISESKHEIIIVSKTASLAEKWLDKIQNELLQNEQIRNTFGNQRGSPWRADHIRLKNGVEIYAKGSGFQIRGYRPSALILDDLEDEDSIRSETQTINLEDWFNSSLINVLDKGKDNQLVMIGNFIGPSCVLKKLVDRVEDGDLPGWESRVWHARVEAPVWSDKWSSEALAERRQEIGSVKFASEYENDPHPEGVTLFREEWLRYYEKLPPRLNVFIAVDTADSMKKRADYSVIMAGASDENNNLYVLAYERGQYSPEGFWNALFKMHQHYHPISMGVEAHTFKNHFRFAANSEMEKRDYFFSFRELPVIQDPLERARPLAAKMESGHVYIRKEHDVLKRELLHYPYKSGNTKDDCVDAMAHLNMMVFSSRHIEPKQTIPDGSPLDALKRSKRSMIMEDIVFSA